MWSAVAQGRSLVTNRLECETRYRLALYCVSPPGEAAWVVDQHRRIEGLEARSSGTRINILKRSLDGENGETEGKSGGGLPGSFHTPAPSPSLPKVELLTILTTCMLGDKLAAK